jgi:hypothetical protein
LREKYRPKQLNVLLIGESPPDPNSGDRRFFYSPHLRADNLYRGVAGAAYADDALVNIRDKPATLAKLQADGFWLIDAVDLPINKQPPKQRRLAIKHAIPILIDRCAKLSPRLGVIIVHGGVYAAVEPALRASGVRVLHRSAILFPLGNFRARFIAEFQACLRDNS